MAFFGRRRRSILRSILRGARRLRSEGKSDFVEKCTIAIVDAGACGWQPRDGSFFGKTTDTATLKRAMAQYILYRVGVNYLPEAILYAHGHVGEQNPRPVIGIFSKKMRQNISQLGVPIAHRRSALLWAGFVIAIWGYGCLTAYKGIWRGVKRAQPIPKDAIHVLGIGPTNLPVPRDKNERPSYDLISWIKLNLAQPDQKILHSVAGGISSDDVQYTPDPIPQFPDFRSWLSYVVWTLWAPLFALFQACIGRWQYAVFLHEAALAARARVIPQDKFASHYLFTNSNMLLRPLWTIFIENRGANIVMLLYSTNMEGFERENGIKPAAPEYRNMIWNLILVWDEEQKIFLENSIEVKPQAKIVGPIWFSDSNTALPKTSRNSIAYFDVTPRRLSWIDKRGYPTPYYTDEISINTMDLLLDISARLSFSLLYKKKRNDHHLDHPNYINYFKQLQSNNFLISLDPELAPQHIIAKSNAVVSMPWTSTALIARDMGKPSCYFDLSGKLNPKDPGAHGIEVISSKEAIENWIRNVGSKK